MRIVWSPNALDKLDQIVEYISEDNLDAALALVEQFDRIVRSLKEHPRSGRVSPVIRDDSVRELVVTKRYIIVYELQESQIDILTIRQSRQDSDP